MHCQHLRTLVPRLLLALLATSSVISAAAAGATDSQQCYGVNGELRPSNIQPCISDRTAGAHVACCDLGKARPDICAGGGMCYSQEGNVIADLLTAQGCTDPTGKDPACPTYCKNTDSVTSYLHACENSKWCCSPTSNGRCCSLDQFNFDPRDVLPVTKQMTLTVTNKVTGTGSAAAVAETKTETKTETKMETKTVKVNAAGQTTAVTGSTAEECPEDKSTVVGASIGAVLGAGLIASLIALGLVLKRQKGMAMGVGPDGKRAVYYPAGMDPAEMDSRYVVELDSRAKHELEGNRGLERG